jgi:hypothetical protein
MLALGAVYFNFWLDNPNDAKNIFHQHLIIIKAVIVGLTKWERMGSW